jgi:uncharacterized lipoprotein YmbA
VSLRALRCAGLLLCATSVAACAHSADPTFFALSPQPGPALRSQPLKIELRRVGMPGYLDRPQIVRRATPERLDLEGDERWGSPLDEMVSATLAEDLAQRLPSSVVFAESGAISAIADVRVEVQLLRFERGADGLVALSAEVAVHSASSDSSATNRYTANEKPPSGRTSDVVISLSRLLAQLADRIAPVVLQQAELRRGAAHDAPL